VGNFGRSNSSQAKDGKKMDERRTKVVPKWNMEISGMTKYRKGPQRTAKEHNKGLQSTAIDRQANLYGRLICGGKIVPQNDDPTQWLHTSHSPFKYWSLYTGCLMSAVTHHYQQLNWILM